MNDDAWQHTRQKGKWHFVFWNGVVLWGLPMTLLQLFVLTEPPAPSSWFYSDTSKYSASWVLFLLALGCLFGLIYGLFTWNKNERIFEKTETASTANPSSQPQDTEKLTNTNILAIITAYLMAAVTFTAIVGAIVYLPGYIAVWLRGS